MTDLITKLSPTYSGVQPYLTVETEQHDPLAAKSVWEAAEDDAAKHHATEVDSGDEGRNVGPVTDQFPLKCRVYTYTQIQGDLFDCAFVLQGLGFFVLPPQPKRLLCYVLPQKVLEWEKYRVRKYRLYNLYANISVILYNAVCHLLSGLIKFSTIHIIPIARVWVQVQQSSELQQIVAPWIVCLGSRIKMAKCSHFHSSGLLFKTHLSDTFWGTPSSFSAWDDGIHISQLRFERLSWVLADPFPPATLPCRNDKYTDPTLVPVCFHESLSNLSCDTSRKCNNNPVSEAAQCPSR